MDLDLAVDRLGEQSTLAVEDGNPGFITGGLDSQNAHGVGSHIL
jgi:hypothetical protein